MPRPESLDAQLTRILTPLHVSLEGIGKELQVVSSTPEANPNLTRRLTDSFYDHMGKFITATTVIGAGYLSYTTFNALGKIDNSWPDFAIKGVVLASSIVGGAGAGYMGGLIAGLGIAVAGYGIEKLEEKIRRHFA